MTENILQLTKSQQKLKQTNKNKKKMKQKTLEFKFFMFYNKHDIIIMTWNSLVTQ